MALAGTGLGELGERHANGESRRLRRWIYVSTSVLMVAIVGTGFWPSYFGPLFSLAVDRSAVIHLHAVVFVGWLVLFAAQAVLAATGHVRRHMQLGRLGVPYGVLVVLIGLLTTLYQYAGRIRADGLEASLEYPTWPLIDMAIFAPFFAAAIAYRRKPEIHKRLMIVAATTLLIAAAGRMALPFNAIRLVWFSPILLGMAYDLVTRRRVSPAYAVGLTVLFVSSFRDHLMQTDFWPAFTGWLGGWLV